jgi:hypothetical protein
MLLRAWRVECAVHSCRWASLTHRICRPSPDVAARPQGIGAKRCVRQKLIACGIAAHNQLRSLYSPPGRSVMRAILDGLRKGIGAIIPAQIVLSLRSWTGLQARQLGAAITTTLGYMARSEARDA